MSRKRYSVTNCLGSSFYIGSPYLQKNYHLATFCEFTKILAILSDSALPGIALNRLLNSSELPFYFSLTGAALSEMIVFVYVPTFMLTVLYSVNTVRIVLYIDVRKILYGSPFCLSKIFVYRQEGKQKIFSQSWASPFPFLPFRLTRKSNWFVAVAYALKTVWLCNYI